MSRSHSKLSLLGPRYSVLDAIIALLLIGGAAAYVSGHFLKQRNDLAAAAFRSPLPEISVAPMGRLVPDEEAYHGKYEFTQDWFTHNLPVWKALFADLKGKPNVNYLEVGLYEGRSALWMLENILTDPTSRLTGIDLFDGELKDRFFENLGRSGAQDRSTIIVEPSQIAMRNLPLNSFDVIYIDGSHATADVLEDAVLSYRLLKPGGILIFDDYRWAGALMQGPLTRDSSSDFPKAAIDLFVQCFDGRVAVVHNSYQLVLQKTTE